MLLIKNIVSVYFFGENRSFFWGCLILGLFVKITGIIWTERPLSLFFLVRINLQSKVSLFLKLLYLLIFGWFQIWVCFLGLHLLKFLERFKILANIFGNEWISKNGIPGQLINVPFNNSLYIVLKHKSFFFVKRNFVHVLEIPKEWFVPFGEIVVDVIKKAMYQDAVLFWIMLLWLFRACKLTSWSLRRRSIFSFRQNWSWINSYFDIHAPLLLYVLITNIYKKNEIQY